MKKIVKRIGLALLMVLVLLVLFNLELVTYGLRQAAGQLNIIWNARPVEEVLADPQFPDSLKIQLRLIQDVRRFATDSLGLKDTRNYTTLFDQKGKEIMWVVIAAEEFALKPKEWTFPVLGEVSYKGFFNQRLAMDLKKDLEAQGWDVIVRNPGGWSTLGWFTDPILSKMLNRSKGDLANLIIHEMSHATIFVKDSVEFNENLATFIGDRGAEMFLISRYGAKSPEYREYMAEDRDYLRYVDHMLRGAKKLDSLYHSFDTLTTVDEKRRAKQKVIKAIVNSLDTLTLEMDTRPSERFRKRLPNNAYFINFRQYQSKQDVFFDEWEHRFNKDLKRYIRHLSEKYPFL